MTASRSYQKVGWIGARDHVSGYAGVRYVGVGRPPFTQQLTRHFTQRGAPRRLPRGS